MGIIEFDNVTFTYDGVSNALDGVNLNIRQGEFLCVLGGNGSGKSTLAKHVNALLAPDAGSVKVLGCDTRDAENVFRIRGNVGMVFQNPDDQIVASIIEDDVAFGPENLGIPNPELRERVTQALIQVGMQGFEKRETSALSGGQKQRVAIAGALAMQPQILVFDEASAMLDPRGRSGLLRVCRELNAAGLTIIYITHFMEEAARADRVVVLDRGRIALVGAPDDVLTRVDQLERLHLDVPFAARMARLLQGRGVSVSACIDTGSLAAQLAGRIGSAGGTTMSAPAADRAAAAGEAPVRLPAAADGRTGCVFGQAASDEATSLSGAASSPAPAIKLGDVSFTYQKREGKPSLPETGAEPAKWGNDPDERWALRNISLEIAHGEFLGIAGHTGSGKSTLMQLAAGLLKPAGGYVEIDGERLSGKKAARRARSHVGVVFQYPERQLFAATVFDDVAFGPRNLGLPASEVEARTRSALEMVHLDFEGLREKSPFALSGGQQRRVAIAGVLAMEPHIVIMDEPTAGLDPQAHELLLELIAELHDARRLTVALVSHNMDDLARMCDRIAVLNQGRLVALDTPVNVFADEEALRGIGLGIPHTVRLAKMLGIETPVPISPGSVPTDEELADTIARAVGGGA